MAEADNRFRIPPELVTGALVAAATLPLARLFAGGIGGVIFGTLIVSGGVAWGLRRLRVPAIPAALASAAAFAWFASALWARSAMWGPFPSPDSIEHLARIIRAGARAAQVEVAPVVATAGLEVLVASLVWGLAWLADDAIAKLRHPLLAIAFCLPIVVFPGTLLPAGRWWVDSALFLTAAMAVLFTDERGRIARWGRVAGIGRPGWRPGLAARMGSMVVIAAIAVSPLVPSEAQTDGAGSAGGDGGGQIPLNPLVSIRPRLSKTPPEHLFTVSSKVPTYWRLTALDTFTGRAWISRLTSTTALISDRSLSPDVEAPETQRVVQEYLFRRLGGSMLPASYDPIRVERRDDVALAHTSRTLISRGGVIANGQRVRVVSQIPLLDAKSLDRPFTYPRGTLDPYRELPRPVSPVVAALAREITKDATTPFRKAVALQDHFNTYIYDENVALSHSIEDMEDFLREQRGYCEQFAGTMAVMARMIGLPSRVAIGFAVGEELGKDRYKVTTRNAHAWVEIFFPEFGWTAFEPTPRLGGGVTQPAYTLPEPVGGAASPTAEPTTAPTPTASPTGGRQPPEGDFVDAPPPEEARIAWVPLAAGILALALVVALPVAATVRRLRRRRRATDPIEAIRVAYVDFLEWCAMVRLPRRRGETPAEYARRLAEISTPAEAPARLLATIATEAFYAQGPRPDADAARSAGAEARAAIAQTLPRRVRVLPLVGWGWWRGDRAPLSAARAAGLD